MKKCIVCIVITILTLFTSASFAYAATEEATNAAYELYNKGLFGGTGTDAEGNPMFDLDRAPTRQEAVTVLVNLLGKSEEARQGTWNMPFADVDEWAKPFVGYAYNNSISSGITETSFGAKNTVTATQYISFVLNVLGYEIGTDFQWDKAWELSDCIGLTDRRYNESTTTFTRGDMVIVSLSAYELMEKLATAPYFGLPEDIKWIPNHREITHLDNNMLYSFLIGNYTLEGTGLRQTAIITCATSSRKRIAQNYPDLAGVFCNTMSSFSGEDGNWYLKYTQDLFTMDELYEQQLIALETAMQIKADLHSSGKIKTGMTEKEIANVYYNYISSLGIVPGYGGSTDLSKGLCVMWDSAYACLVNRVADCVGRAAGFNLLMHVEGIEAQGVSGRMGGSGHIISRMVLDGEEYFCDWGNRKGIHKNGISGFEFDEGSLERARNIL